MILVHSFATRRRYINLLWALVSNSALPLCLGFVIGLIAATHVFTDTFLFLDKAGFGFCVLPPGQADKHQEQKL